MKTFNTRRGKYWNLMWVEAMEKDEKKTKNKRRTGKVKREFVKKQKIRRLEIIDRK